MLEGSVDFHFGGSPEMLESQNWRDGVERKEVLVREGENPEIMVVLWLLVVAKDVKGKEE